MSNDKRSKMTSGQRVIGGCMVSLRCMKVKTSPGPFVAATRRCCDRNRIALELPPPPPQALPPPSTPSPYISRSLSPGPRSYSSLALSPPSIPPFACGTAHLTSPSVSLPLHYTPTFCPRSHPPTHPSPLPSRDSIDEHTSIAGRPTGP
jgi:hypothetical protein